jgi:hypothetical protein
MESRDIKQTPNMERYVTSSICTLLRLRRMSQEGWDRWNMIFVRSSWDLKTTPPPRVKI